MSVRAQGLLKQLQTAHQILSDNSLDAPEVFVDPELLLNCASDGSIMLVPVVQAFSFVHTEVCDISSAVPAHALDWMVYIGLLQHL